MGRAFIDRFYELVEDNLADPHTSRRLTAAKKLRDFESVEVELWERLLAASGAESMLGRHEANITLENDKEFYPLPGNFRKFWSFDHRTDVSDPNTVVNYMGSITELEPGPGVVIMSASRGMIVRPRPTFASDEQWTLTYQKGPVKIHNAQASAVTATTIKAGTPGTDSGELVFVDGYYNGAMLKVYSATIGAPQTREISNWNAGDRTFTLKHALSPIPSPPVFYEIVPILPEPYDSIYALDVAIRNLGRRSSRSRRRELKDERREAFSAALSWVVANVADRPPQRTINYLNRDPDPYEE